MTNKHQYHFFVDSVRYETDEANLTGAQIKALVPEFNPSYQLYLEEPGDHPDRPVADAETIQLDPSHGGVKKFYSVPPASFGDR